jgi:hypothetical protein
MLAFVVVAAVLLCAIGGVVTAFRNAARVLRWIFSARGTSGTIARFAVAAIALEVGAWALVWMFGDRQPEQAYSSAPASQALSGVMAQAAAKPHKPTPVIDGPEYLASKNTTTTVSPADLHKAILTYISRSLPLQGHSPIKSWC